MLLLSRKRGEKVIITIPGGRQIVLELVELRGAAARLGFIAPTDVKIDRMEVHLERTGQ